MNIHQCAKSLESQPHYLSYTCYGPVAKKMGAWHVWRRRYRCYMQFRKAGAARDARVPCCASLCSCEVSTPPSLSPPTVPYPTCVKPHVRLSPRFHGYKLCKHSFEECMHSWKSKTLLPSEQTIFSNLNINYSCILSIPVELRRSLLSWGFQVEQAHGWHALPSRAVVNNFPLY